MNKETIITDIIYPAIEDIKDLLEDPDSLELKEDAVLLGNVDSLNLVSLIVAVEEKTEEILDKNIVLADEKAMSLRNSPFKNVSNLADYILELTK